MFTVKIKCSMCKSNKFEYSSHPSLTETDPAINETKNYVLITCKFCGNTTLHCPFIIDKLKGV